MTESSRRTAATPGQLHARTVVELRRRGSSGTRTWSTGSASVEQHTAALLDLLDDIGDPCRAAGPTASACLGFDGFVLAPPFHVVVPRGRNIHRVGHVVHTTTDLPLIDRARVGGIPIMSATRTIIDLAATEPAERLTLAVDSAFRDGHSSEDFLHRRLVEMRSRGRKGLTGLVAVLRGIEVTRGAHSWLEREFLRRNAVAGLPRPITQEVIAQRGTRLIRVDCSYPGTDLVVELLGYAFHRSALQLQHDADRMNRLLLAGRRVLQFTYTDVVHGHEAMVDTIRRALAAR